MFFTAWPPIILGLFDRPISQKLILKHPRLYQSFQKMAFSNYVNFQLFFNLIKILEICAMGFFVVVALTFIVFL